MTNKKARESRLRRMADRQGLRLRKSRRRNPRAIDFGGYMLVDAGSNEIVWGGNPHPFSATLDEIEDFLTYGPV